MSVSGEAATRSALTRLRRRRDRIAKGVGLLRRKREALVGELFRIARPAIDARLEMTERATKAYDGLIDAMAMHGRQGLETLGWPIRDPRIEVRAAQVWGLPVSEIVDRPVLTRTLAASGTSPGSIGPAAAATVTQFEQLAEILLDAAPRESLLRRLGDALMRTSRQVNMLEQRLAPRTASQINTIQQRLDESEREDHVRLRHLVRRKATD
jgi:V/A-type H+-transporting ATPase subunit D